jgi:hypothetical protein
MGLILLLFGYLFGFLWGRWWLLRQIRRDYRETLRGDSMEQQVKAFRRWLEKWGFSR